MATQSFTYEREVDSFVTSMGRSGLVWHVKLSKGNSVEFINLTKNNSPVLSKKKIRIKIGTY